MRNEATNAYGKIVKERDAAIERAKKYDLW